MAAILQLIDEAAAWLRTKGTDQWSKPWPTRADRDGRILAGLRQDKTWVCRDNEITAATITADPDGDAYWPQSPDDPAVYVHRLVVSRSYAGRGLGADLLDWAGRAARSRHGSRWIRVSAWTTNRGLHEYYRRHGFVACGYHPDDGYPSAARFQKSTALIGERERPLLMEA